MAEAIQERRVDFGRSQARRPGRFLRGPIPMAWLRLAMDADGNALAVGLVLWHIAGMEGSRTIEVSHRRLAQETGASRRTCQRGMKSLEQDGLIQIETRPGGKTRITIVPEP